MPSTATPSTSLAAFSISAKTRKILWWGLCFMLVARIVCNTVIPLADDTEARYGEIARKMIETNDWVTPLHDYKVDRATCEEVACVELGKLSYGVPFWAKPPLSTWLAAISMKLLGVNEFAARLPSTLLGIAMLVLVWHWCAPRRGRDFALAACTTLAGMSLFFMAAGAVMTDSSLTICTTLTMVSFWKAMHPEQLSDDRESARRRQRIWGYLFFVGLGFGLLAKGPLVGVLTFMPILPWLLLHKDRTQEESTWLRAWRSLPWISGSILMLVIGLPWYLIAEHATPGFIAYFILGENLGRFLHTGWSGDKYGHAHAEPLGMIWAFWLITALPWSVVFLTRIKAFFSGGRTWIAGSDGWLSYLLLWSFMPIVFFTFAHNIIWPYPFQTLPALAVLTMELLSRGNSKKPIGTALAALNFFTPAVLLIVAAMYASDHYGLLKASQKDSAEYYLHVRSSPDDGLYFYRHRYFSAEFYTAGKARAVKRGHIGDLLDDGHTDFLVMYADELAKLSPDLRAHFRQLKTFGDFVMLREITAETSTAQPHT